MYVCVLLYLISFSLLAVKTSNDGNLMFFLLFSSFHFFSQLFHCILLPFLNGTHKLKVQKQPCCARLLYFACRESVNQRLFCLILSKENKLILYYVLVGPLESTIYTGWGKSRVLVLCVENNTVINK